MEGGPCPNCGEVPFSLGNYYRPTNLSLSNPCEHCGEKLAFTWQAWTGALVTLAAAIGLFMVVSDWFLAMTADLVGASPGPEGWRFWAYVALSGLGGGLVGGLFGALYVLIPWKLGWWRVAHEGEGGDEQEAGEARGAG